MSDNRKEMLDFCLKCSICHTQCPMVAKNPSYPGPKHLGPEAERLRLTGKNPSRDEQNKYLSYCLNCKRCDEACPHGVKPSVYNVKNKTSINNAGQESLRDWILAHNDWWGRIAGKMPGVSNFFLKNPFIKTGMSLLGIAPQRSFPAYKSKKLKIARDTKDKKAVYFRGCYARSNEPDIAQSVIKLLEYAGYQVEIAPLGCCGTPVISNGLMTEAKKIAEKNIQTLCQYVEKGYKIVSSCPSCTLTLKEEYDEFFDIPASKKVSQNVWDIFELLLHDNVEFPGSNKKFSRVIYHVPCHLKAQGIGTPAANLIRKYVVNSLKVMDKYCCGISGTFGFKKEKYDLSMKIGNDLFEEIKKEPYSLVLTDCGTCKLQIEQGTGQKVIHPAVVLAETIEK
ncbi:MAG: glycerol-3-phosphate dehydrogenase subunit [Clostridia bacterium]|nr:glycerol-3-phosphate dehydrogenase subunit [Clostridia bacterium]